MVIVTMSGKNPTDDINLIVYKRYLRSDGSQSLEIVWGSVANKAMTSWRIVGKVQGSILIVILYSVILPIVVRSQANDATIKKNLILNPYKIVETNQ